MCDGDPQVSSLCGFLVLMASIWTKNSPFDAIPDEQSLFLGREVFRVLFIEISLFDPRREFA
jgi:hypothetical protein